MENIVTMDAEVIDVDINFLTVSQSFEERVDVSNGVNLLPEEMITKIFEYVEPYELLKLSEVCHKWNVIIKQPYLWRKKYQCKYKEQPKRYKWFVLFSMVATDYYDVQPVRQGYACNEYHNWTDNTERLISPLESFDVITLTESVPLYLRSFSRCVSKTNVCINKPEIINFGNNRLVTSIVKTFKPIVYCVEWLRLFMITHSYHHEMVTEIMGNGRLAEYCTKHAFETAMIELLKMRTKMSFLITDRVLLDKISFAHVISVNQPTLQERLGDNFTNVVERKPKIFAGSLPI